MVCVLGRQFSLKAPFPWHATIYFLALKFKELASSPTHQNLMARILEIKMKAPLRIYQYRINYMYLGYP